MADPNLESRIRALSPDQQRQLLGMIRQKNTFSTPTTEGAIGQSTGAPYQQAPLEKTDVPLWRQGLNAFAKPFDVLTQSVFHPVAGAVLEPMRLGMGGDEAGARKAGLRNALQGPLGTVIQGFAQYREGSEKSQQYEDWQAPKGVKFATENLPWAFVPGATGVAAKLAPLGRGGKIASTVLRNSPWGLTERAIGAGVTQIASKIATVPVPIRKLNDALKAARPALAEQQEARTADLAQRLAKAESTFGAHEGQEAFNRAKAQLAGKYAVGELEPMTTMTALDVDDLANIIGGSKLQILEKIQADAGMQDLILNGQLPQQHQLELLEGIFGSEFAKLIKSRRSMSAKAFETMLDVAGLPRAVLSSIDVSGLMRQGGILGTRFPKVWAQSIKPMLKSLGSDDATKLIDDTMRADPGFALMERSGLYIAPIPANVSVTLTKLEESFASRLSGLVPGVNMSNRAYVTVLNQLRTGAFKSMAKSWENLGATAQDYNELAKFINFASGRGSLGSMNRGGLGPVLNATLFSPRLLMSRLQLPTMLFSRSKLVRKLAWQNMATFLGAGAALIGLPVLTGAATTELDPRSADFGKLKVGDTRLDVWTGYSQYTRAVAQFITGERKTQGGYAQDVKRNEVLGRFMQSKFSPAMGLLYDILRGETYMGESMELDTKNFETQVFRRLTPLFIQDMYDAIKQEGAVGALHAAPGVVGVGVVTYSDPIGKIRDNAAKQAYGMTWDEVGKTYGRKTQNELEVSTPEIQEALEDLQTNYMKSYSTDDTIWGDWYSFGRDIDDSYRKAIQLASAEFKATGDGVTFREKVNSAEYARRAMYDARESDARFGTILEQLDQPIDPKTTSDKDVARYAYYKMMYADDIYDEFGNYRFDLAEQRRAEFVKQFGSDSLQYIQEYSTSRWEEPPEMKVLRQSKEILRPYWAVEAQVWAQIPNGQQLKALSDQIKIVERTDTAKAKAMLVQYPEILWVRKRVAEIHKQMKLQSPQMQQALSLFYSY